MNQAGHCADPGARRVVSREARVPWAGPRLSLSPPSPFIIGSPVTHIVTHASNQRGPQARTRGVCVCGGGLQCHFFIQAEKTDKDKRKEVVRGINKNKEKQVEERGARGGQERGCLIK